MTAQKSRLELPMSHELRGWDMLYRAHIGSTSDLVQLAVEMDMERELVRSRAVGEIEARILGRMTLDGYLTTDAVRQEVRDWHEGEALGENAA